MFLLSLTIVTIAGFKTKQLNIAQSCLCRLNWKACLSTDGYTTEIQFHVASSRKNKNAVYIITKYSAQTDQKEKKNICALLEHL